jgi:hypothetical protein
LTGQVRVPHIVIQRLRRNHRPDHCNVHRGHNEQWKRELEQSDEELCSRITDWAAPVCPQRSNYAGDDYDQAEDHC